MFLAANIWMGIIATSIATALLVGNWQSYNSKHSRKGRIRTRATTHA